MTDFPFSSTDLVNGKLEIPGAALGGFSVEDAAGNAVYPYQRRISTGVEVDFTDYGVTTNWWIRFFRGEPGINTTGGITESEAIMYALIFG